MSGSTADARWELFFACFRLRCKVRTETLTQYESEGESIGKDLATRLYSPMQRRACHGRRAGFLAGHCGSCQFQF